MHPDWARSLRDQCAAAGVPFFFKQGGDWSPDLTLADPRQKPADHFIQIGFDGTRQSHLFDDTVTMVKVGKKKAGRLLDGIEHNGFPIVKGARA